MAKANAIGTLELTHDLHREFHHLDVSKPALQEVISRTFELILERMSRGEAINIRNFGTFEGKVYKGRLLHTPLMAKATQFPDQRILRFKQSVTAKKRLNELSTQFDQARSEAKLGGKKAKRAVVSTSESDDEVQEAPVKTSKKTKKSEAAVVADIAPAKKSAKDAKAVKQVTKASEADGFAHSKGKKPKPGAEAEAIADIKAKKGKNQESTVGVKTKKVKVPAVVEETVETEDEDLEDEVVDTDDEDLDDSEDDLEESDEDDDLDNLDEEDEVEEAAPAKKAKKSKA